MIGSENTNTMNSNFISESGNNESGGREMNKPARSARRLPIGKASEDGKRHVERFMRAVVRECANIAVTQSRYQHETEEVVITLNAMISALERQEEAEEAEFFNTQRRMLEARLDAQLEELHAQLQASALASDGGSAMPTGFKSFEPSSKPQPTATKHRSGQATQGEKGSWDTTEEETEEPATHSSPWSQHQPQQQPQQQQQQRQQPRQRQQAPENFANSSPTPRPAASSTLLASSSSCSASVPGAPPAAAAARSAPLPCAFLAPAAACDWRQAASAPPAPALRAQRRAAAAAPAARAP